VRSYGRIQTQFWTDEKILRLTDGAKLLMSYFLTGPHTNAIGCFRLPSGYIEADFGWVTETVTQTVSELLREGLILRDQKTGWTLLPNFLKHNPIENPNVAKAAMPLIEAIPQTLEMFSVFIKALEPYAERFPKGFLNGLANRYPNRSPNPHGNPMGNMEPEPEPEPYPEPEMEMERGCWGKPIGADAPPAPPDKKSDRQELDRAVGAWNDLASRCGLSQVSKLTDQRKAKLRARLRDSGGVETFCAAVEKIASSPFLRGEKKDWKADFDWLLQEKSFTKLREGAYDERGADAGQDAARVEINLPPEIIEKLRRSGLEDEAIKRWFEGASFENAGRKILVKTSFVRDWIEQHFSDRLAVVFGARPEICLMAA
jgi:hypothetical protein